MKILKHLLLVIVCVVGFSMTAMAQKDDQKNRPPKEEPPKIDPGKKEPKEKPKNDNRNNDNRGKKPQIVFIGGNLSEINFV